MLFLAGFFVPPIEEQKDLVHKIAVLADEYHQDPELALKIIRCEGWNHLATGDNKNLKDGIHWSTDIGWWQINDYYHRNRALKLGFDISDPDQNLKYGMLLLKEEGTKPWLASAKCWNR